MWTRQWINGAWRLTWRPEVTFVLPAFTFDREREQCLRCAHVRTSTHHRAKGRILDCAASKGRGQGNRDVMACSYARLPGQDCGPEGSLYLAKK